MKRVSIILVNYNGYEDTVECVESLLQIDYSNYEIIIVDNGSRDDYRRMYEKYHSSTVVAVLDSGENLGFSGGNNVGIRYALAQGCDYILLLNNDTLVEKDFLSSMVFASQEKNDEYAITNKIMYAFEKDKIWCAGGNIDYKTSRTSAFGINEIEKEEYNRIREISFASGCCILIPMKVLDYVGLMKEDYFLYCEDTDYCLRIKKAGFKILYEPKSKIYHKVNASTNKIAGIQTYYLVRNKLYIIKDYIQSRYKLRAYLYVAAETMKRILTREYSFLSAISGAKDFMLGIKGKK